LITDRRTVDELTVEELEQILIVKRRQARAERMRRLREIGRGPKQKASPPSWMCRRRSDSALLKLNRCGERNRATDSAREPTAAGEGAFGIGCFSSWRSGLF
jgi:hypothetical protein